MPNWRRNLAVMVLVQFMMSTAQSNIAPFLPLYIQELGVSDPARTALWSGILYSVTPLIAALVSPIWGSLADRRGRKLMVLRACLGVGTFTLLLSFSQNIWQALFLKLMQGVFGGFGPTAVTLVASSTPEKRLGYALGWLQTGQLTGIMMGPLIGGVLADVLGSYRWVFHLTGSFILGVSLLIIFLVKENFTPQCADQRPSYRRTVGELVHNPAVMALFVALFLSQFTVRGVEPLISLFVQTLAPNAANLSTLAGLVFSVSGVAGLISAPILGRWGDSTGHKLVLIVSLAGAAAFFVPQAFISSYWSFLALRFGLGVFVGGILPTTNTLIGRLTSPEKRGQLYGLTSSAFFLGSFAGPLAGGAISAWLGIRFTFLFCAVLLLFNLFWIARHIPDDRKGSVSSVFPHSHSS